MSSEITLDSNQLMEAFNQGEPWAVFELYATFWPHTRDLLPFLIEDTGVHDKIAFCAYLHFLVIDYNQWTFVDAKASFDNAARQFAKALKAWDKEVSFPWITDHIIRIKNAYSRKEVLMIFRNLNYLTDMRGIFENIKMVLLDHENAVVPPNWEADLAMAKTHLLLAYLRIYPTCENP